MLEAAASRFGIGARVRPFRLRELGLLRAPRQDDARRLEGAIGGHDAIFFGAVGWPAKIPDHVSLWGSLLKFRREFDQYVNLRPARLMPGIRSPLVAATAAARPARST